MTGISSLNKMFRWLKDKKKNKHDRQTRGEVDDYGFKKKQIILQETENGHSVIIKDDETTLVYPQSFCRLNYRARMPTPVQNFTETSTHIYDEIPEMSVRTRLQFESNQNEADIIKDTRSSQNCPMDFTNAIEVGPYLIVPIVNSSDSNGDVEIFKRDENSFQDPEIKPVVSNECHCGSDAQCTCNIKETYSPPWDANKVSKTRDVTADTKVVLTRCVKSKSGLISTNSVQPVCSIVDQSDSNTCSFDDGAGCTSNTDSPTLTEISDSRTLTETPDCQLERNPSAIADNKERKDNTETKHVDGNDTCCEYDLSTSGESDKSAASDYELYLSKIENNLRLKHDVRKMVDTLECTIPEVETETPAGGASGEEIDTMTYVSNLSEYSSAASHISDISADRSASDDSSGYYECSEEVTESRDKKRDSRVNLERSVSAPETGLSSVKSKKTKDKVYTKNKKSANARSHSFDHKPKKLISAEEKEVYKFPSSKNSNSPSSRQNRGKSVLAPQPTPVYMDPYRGKSRSHNRLLGDLIRMNYDKQLFIH